MVWSDRDKSLIAHNFTGKIYIPNIEVTNILHLEDSIVRDDSLKYGSKILICLQGLWIPNWMEEYILKNEHYDWQFRLHPRYPNDVKKLMRLSKIKKSNIFIDEAKDNRLVDILFSTKVLVTGFSGSALEAHKSNVSVFIYGTEGKKSFKNLISEGVFHYVDNAKNFDRKLKELEI